MTKLHFNYKDIFRAFRLGFAAKKIWVAFQGLVVGWIVYAGITYLTHFLAGANMAEIWTTYRLFPMPCCFAAWWHWLIWAVGVAWFVFVGMVAGIAISKLTYEQLRGDEFYEVKEAWKQAIKSAGSLIATPILLGLFIVLLLAAGVLLGLLGRIPFAGELIVGLFAIPAFAISLFIIYLMIVFFFTFTISPAVIGTTKSDAFDNLFEVFSCVSDQSWRLIWYQFMLLAFILVGVALLAFFSTKAIELGRWAVNLTMNVSPEKAAGAQVPDKLNLMILQAKQIAIPEWMLAVKDWSAGIKGTVSGFFSGAQPVADTAVETAVVSTAPGTLVETTEAVPVFNTAAVSVKIGAILFAIGLHAILFFVLAYGMSIWFSGNTLVYLILVRKKDDRNLLDIKDEEIEIPEKIDVTPEPEPKTKKKTTRKPTSKKKTTKKKTTTKKSTSKKSTTRKKKT
ncbi:hypothetical protein GF359_03470 [candidate division WOR-3 bacterium]|uniref:Uncharacterized protein n=1 Tax=candidate division WOR-3 bacterium TaxID=2052148 RepID=A0A9D5K8V2_UNCW3|nr:hypothetical protein [candidate division WOR-3 bacterium]MBD3364254.1 hypothetical protein [candidate division WOR-3 bacterium]